MGRGDRHLDAVLRVLRHSAHDGRVAHAAGFTGLGVGATRFAADVLLDLLDGADTERTRLEMVRKQAAAVPAGAVRLRWGSTRPGGRWTGPTTGRAGATLWLRTLDRLGLGFDS